MDNREIRRLVWWNRLWLALVLAGALVWLLAARLEQVSNPPVKVWWQGQDLQFGSMSDGPFVVTHLVIHHAGHAPEAVALLPEPVVISESGRKTLHQSAWRKLRWNGYSGNPVPSPEASAPIRALYYRAEWTWRQEQTRTANEGR